MYEIYFNEYKKYVMVDDFSSNESKPLKEMGYTFLKKIEDQIQNNYPEAYDILTSLYGSEKTTIFGRINHFLQCNFYIKTGKPNIDEDWNLIFTKTYCPARFTESCTLNKKLCNLKFNTDLSSREIEVLRLFARGMGEEEIANILFLSKNTIHNHINNMYKKLDMVGKISPDRKLVSYAYINGFI
jgi:hypothetical protein